MIPKQPSEEKADTLTKLINDAKQEGMINLINNFTSTYHIWICLGITIFILCVCWSHGVNVYLSLLAVCCLLYIIGKSLDFTSITSK